MHERTPARDASRRPLAPEQPFRRGTDGLVELQVRWPNVPVVFCESRQLAEEWTYRFLAAAHVWAGIETALAGPLTPLAAPTVDAAGLAPAAGAPEPSTAEVQAWARATGLVIPGPGELRPEVWGAWRAAHPG
jgi:hypothetical protein